MKKLWLLLLIVPFLAFGYFENKKYKVELTVEQWNRHIAGLNYVQSELFNTDMPGKTIKVIIDSILTPIRADISNQVSKQLPKDSIK